MEQPLTAEEARVLGCLIEKSMTTPDQYPMSLNAVRVACNQVSNRDPVVDYDETAVAQTLRALGDRGYAKFVHRAGDRVVKYIHALDEAMELSDEQLALVAVLLLRGAQTPGELRQRTGRYVEFSGLPQIETTLEGLRRRDPAMVEELPRRPGQKESRWRQLLTGDDAPPPPVSAAQDADEAPPPETVAPETGAADTEAAETDELADLRTEVETLRTRFERLLDALGVDEI